MGLGGSLPSSKNRFFQQKALELRSRSDEMVVKNHNKIKIEWFGTKTTFVSRTDPRKMMGSWQASHFVQNFDADLVGWV